MSLITGSLKSILSISIKQRHDSVTDQVSRIFVAKVFMVASLVAGVDWFHDTVYCVLPQGSQVNEDFVNTACWIRGFYIYPQMDEFMRQSAYYGIPQLSGMDGIYSHMGERELCQTTKIISYETNEQCTPMDRHYFAHIQWMPFYLASLALVFYLPYYLFRLTNSDIISLKNEIKINTEQQSKEIVHNYFNHDINPLWKMRARVVTNIAVKLSYVCINLFAFSALNLILNRQFSNYGVAWTHWLQQNSSMMMDFNARTAPTPGNKMLPTFGFCDVHELAGDSRSKTDNSMTVLCEISSNVLYQYIIAVVWFVLVFAIFMSLLGVLLNLTSHLVNMVCMSRRDRLSRLVYRYLSLRECEYLEFVRQRNLVLYGAVMYEMQARLSKDLHQASMAPLAQDCAMPLPDEQKKEILVSRNTDQDIVLVIGNKAHTIRQNDKNKKSFDKIMNKLHAYNETMA